MMRRYIIKCDNPEDMVLGVRAIKRLMKEGGDDLLIEFEGSSTWYVDKTQTGYVAKLVGEGSRDSTHWSPIPDETEMDALALQDALSSMRVAHTRLQRAGLALLQNRHEDASAHVFGAMSALVTG